MTLEQFAAANPSADPAETIRNYRNQQQLELLKSGEYDDLAPELDGVLQEYAATNGIEVNFNQRNDRKDLEYVSQYSQDPAAQAAARTYLAVDDPKIKDTYGDPVKYDEVLSSARAAVEQSINPIERNKARRAALDSGDTPFAVFQDPTTGEERLDVSPALKDLAGNDEALAAYFEANPDLDVSRIPEIRQKLRTPDGFTVPAFQIDRQHDWMGAFTKVLGEDKNIARKVTDLRAAADKGTPVNEALLDQIDTELGAYGMHGDTSPEAAAERKAYIKDFINMSAAPEVDEENLDNNIRTLSTGQKVLPMAVMLQRPLFDKVVASPSIPESQRTMLKENRDAQISAMAPEMFKTIAANRPMEFPRFMQERKDKGMSNAAILDEWMADPDNYSQARAFLGGVGESVLEGFGGLVMYPAAMLGNESARKALTDLQKSDMDRRNYAQMFGKNLGVGYDLTRLVAPVAADVSVSLLTGGAATAAVTSKNIVKSGIKTALKGAVEAGAYKAFTRGAATQSVDQIIDSAGKNLARKFVKTTTTASYLGTAFNRSAGSTYVQLYSQLSEEKNPDGSAKYTPEKAREIALNHGLIAGTMTAAITGGFSFLGAGGIESIYGNVSRKQLGRIFDKVKQDFDQLAPSVRAGLDMTNVDSFITSVAKKAVRPMLSEVGKGFKDEAMEEGLDQFAGYFNQQIATGDEINIADAFKQAGYAAMLGGIMGGTVVGINEAASGAPDVNTEALARRTALYDIAAKLDAASSPRTAEAIRRFAVEGFPATPKESVPAGAAPEGTEQAPSGPAVAGEAAAVEVAAAPAVEPESAVSQPEDVEYFNFVMGEEPAQATPTARPKEVLDAELQGIVQRFRARKGPPIVLDPIPLKHPDRIYLDKLPLKHPDRVLLDPIDVGDIALYGRGLTDEGGRILLSRIQMTRQTGPATKAETPAPLTPEQEEQAVASSMPGQKVRIGARRDVKQRVVRKSKPQPTPTNEQNQEAETPAPSVQVSPVPNGQTVTPSAVPAGSGAQVAATPEAQAPAAVARDSSKPEQMTPEEHQKARELLRVKAETSQNSYENARLKKYPKAADAQLRHMDMVSTKKKLADDARAQADAFPPTLAFAIEEAINSKSPFSVAAYESVGMSYIPTGYVKQGELYVYQPEQGLTEIPNVEAALYEHPESSNASEEDAQLIADALNPELSASPELAMDEAVADGKDPWGAARRLISDMSPDIDVDMLSEQAILDMVGGHPTVQAKLKLDTMTQQSIRAVDRQLQGAAPPKKAFTEANSPVTKEIIQYGGLENITRFLQNVVAKAPKHQKDVAKLILEFGDMLGTVPITQVHLPNFPFSGAYIPETGQILINTAVPGPRGAVDTVLHELLHAATTHSIANPTPAQQKVLVRLERIRQSVKKRAEKNGMKHLAYGLSSLDEMLTHWFTSPTFQSDVSALTPKGERNWVQVIVEAIKDLLNGKVRTQQDKVSQEIMSDLIEFTRDAAQTAYGPTPRMDALMQLPEGDVRNTARFIELTRGVTPENVEQWRAENPEAYAELREMREEVLRDAGWDVKAYHAGITPNISEFNPLTHFGSDIRQLEGIRNRRKSLKEKPADAEYEVLLKLENPKRVDDTWNWGARMSEAVSEGYDGLVYKNYGEGFNTDEGATFKDSYVPANPNQIKSTEPLNFDSENQLILPHRWADAGSPDIRFQLPEGDRSIKAIHYSREPMALQDEVSDEERDNVFGNGFYAMEPADEKMWTEEMGRWSPGEYRNEVTLNPTNPLVITPEDYLSIFNDASAQMEQNGYARVVLSDTILTRMEQGNHDAVIIRGFDANRIEEMDRRTSDMIDERFVPQFEQGRTEGRFTNSDEFHQIANQAAQEVAGMSYDALQYMSEMQNQIFVPANKTTSVVNTSPDIRFQIPEAPHSPDLVRAIAAGFTPDDVDLDINFDALIEGTKGLNPVNREHLIAATVNRALSLKAGFDALGGFAGTPPSKIGETQDGVAIYEVDAEDLGGAFGLYTKTSNDDPLILVSRALPKRVKDFVIAHETYHSTDAKFETGGELRAEIMANLMPGFKDPVGLMRTALASMTPERLQLYANRLRGQGPILSDALMNTTWTKDGFTGYVPRQSSITSDERERLTRMHEMIMSGYTLDSDIGFYRSNPTAMQKLVRFLTAAVKAAYARLKLRFDNRTAVFIDRMTRELSRAKEGYRTRSTRKRFDPADPDANRQDVLMQLPEQDFYSQLSRTIEQKMPKSATPEQVMQIAASGAKAEEVKWSGLEQALSSLATDGKVSKDAVLRYLSDEGAVRFEEVTLGKTLPTQQTAWQRIRDAGYDIQEDGYGDVMDRETGENVEFRDLPSSVQRDVQTLRADEDNGNDVTNATKFSEYTLPGGENYREVVLAMPSEGGKPRMTDSEVMTAFEKQMRDSQLTRGDYTDEEIERYLSYGADYAREIVDDSEGVPSRSEYTSSHFPDVPNYVAHMRTNERDGGLFIEELQSDRHQAGRKQGYAGDKASEIETQKAELLAQEAEQSELMATLEPLLTWEHNGMEVRANGYLSVKVKESGRWETYSWDSRRPAEFNAGLTEERGQAFMDFMEAKDRRDEFARKAGNLRDEGIPDAPFRTTWPLALFKRALRDAVASGKDWIGWTPGSVHTDRWGTERIEWAKQTDGSFLINAKSQHGGNAGGIDLEGEADARNMNPQNSKTVTTEAQLVEAIRPSLTEGQNPEALGAKLWKRMQTEGSGVSMPRKEGFEGFYDRDLKSMIDGYIKVWKDADGNKPKAYLSSIETEKPRQGAGNEPTIGEIADFAGITVEEYLNLPPDDQRKLNRDAQKAFTAPTETTPIWRIDITPAMRSGVQQGQALFQLPEPGTEYTAWTEVDVGNKLFDSDPNQQPRGYFGRMFKQSYDLRDATSAALKSRDALQKAAQNVIDVLRDKYQRALKEGADPDLLRVAIGSNKPMLTLEDELAIEAEFNIRNEAASNIAAPRIQQAQKDRAAARRRATTDEERDAVEEDYALAVQNAKALQNKAFSEVAEWERTAMRDRALANAERLREQSSIAMEKLKEQSPIGYEWAFEMRKTLDEIITKNAKEYANDRPELAWVMDNSQGVYLVRTFNFHRDPTMADKLLHSTDPAFVELQEVGINFFGKHLADLKVEELRENPAYADYDELSLRAQALTEVREEAKKLFEDYVMGQEGASAPAGSGLHDIRTEFQRFLRKKDLPDEILEILGEIDDPLFNSMRTFSSVTGILFNQRMLKAVRKDGLKSGWLIDEATKTADKKYSTWVPFVAANEKSESYAPLAGLYAAPKDVEALKAALNVGGRMSLDTAGKTYAAANRALIGAAGLSMGVMTLGSVGYFSRNMIGGVLLALSQGTNPASKLGWESMKTAYTASFGKNTDADVQELIARRVLGDGVNITYLKEFLQKYREDPINILQWAENKGFKLNEQALDKLRTAGGGWTKMTDFLSKAAEFTETFQNPLIYFSEFDALMESGLYEGNEEGAKQEAARRTKMVTPGKSENPQAVTQFSKNPLSALVAPFIRFKAEMMRTTWNTYLLAYQDITSGNATMRDHGINRMQSAIVVHGALTIGLPLLMQYVLGISDEEDEAIRKGMPTYSRNSTFIYIKDKETGELTTWDLSFANPFSFVFDPFTQVIKAGGREDYSEIPAIATRFVTSDLMGEQIVAGKALDVSRNIDESTGLPIYMDVDNMVERFTKSAMHILEGSYTPQVLRKSAQAIQATYRPDTDEEPFFYTPLGILVGHVAPVRPRSHKPEDLAYRAFRNIQKSNAELWQITGPMSSPAPMDPEDVTGIYEKRKRAGLKVWQEMYRTGKAFQEMGLTQHQVARQATDAGLSKKRVGLALNGFMERPIIAADKAKDIREIDERRLDVYREAVRKTPQFIRLD